MARFTPSGTTAATAAQATAPAPQPKPATAALPAPSKPAAAAAPPAPRAAAPKAPAAPKAAPAKPTTTGPGVGPLTYGQSYPEGMSAADFAYDNLGQSDATDIAPFEEFPTSPTTPGEGTSFYRERMMAPKPGYVGLGAGQMYVAPQLGKPGTFVQPTGTPRDLIAAGERPFQSVAEFRDYAQRVGAGLAQAQRDLIDVDTRMELAASRDDTTVSEMEKLYQERLKKLSAVAGMKHLLQQQGFSEADMKEVVMRHAAEREY